MRPWMRVAAALFAIAYGANEFSPLMVLYRDQADFPAVTVAAFFGVYVAGLAPGVLLGGPASDRFGRRALMLPALLVSIPASGVLALGGVPAVSEPALYAGRFLFGVVTGVAMAVGTTWVKELSQRPHDDGADGGSGARRAALAISAGFGIGPLVAGLVAEFAPLPLELPYLLHVLITVPVVVALLGAPETRAPGPFRLRVPVPARFLRVVAPMAPWVFAGPAVSFAVQPAALGERISGFALPLATLLTALTLGTGVAIQTWARRLDARSPVRAPRIGLAALATGSTIAAATAATGWWPLAPVASVVLGAGYGLCLVAGLLEVQRMATAQTLAGLTALFYALTYVGFLVPLALALLVGLAAYPALLLGVAALQLLSLAAIVRAGRPAGALSLS